MGSNWKNRFENAKVTPPAGLWANIEAGLAPPPAKPWILTTLGIAATATLLLAAGITTYIFFQNSNSSNQEIVETVDPILEPHPEKMLFEETNPIDPKESVLESVPVAEVQNSKETDEIEKGDRKDVDQSTSDEAQSESIKSPVVNTPALAQVNTEESIPSNVNPSANPEEVEESVLPIIDISDELNETQIAQNSDSSSTKNNVANRIDEEVILEELPLLDDLINTKKDKKSGRKNRLWAGVYQGIGGFASNISSGSAALSAEASPTFGEEFSLSDAIANEQSTSRNIDEKQVINTTLLVGVPMSQKLSLVTGLQYSKSSFGSTAASIDNQLLHFTSSFQDLESISAGNFERTDLDGFYEMAVVPIMADYQILSQRFSWSVQAGPSIGLLLRQKISSDELGLSQTTQPGDLYEPIHFRVAIGSALSYSIGDRYQVSIRPVVDQAVTSLTTSEANFKSRPLNYSISLGLLYQF